VAATRSTTFASLTAIKAYLKLSPAASVSLSTLTSSGLVATATAASAHGLVTGDSAVIAGADQVAYNGTVTVTVLSTTQFTYPLGASAVSPATGTLTVSGPDTAEDVRLAQIADGVSDEFERRTNRLLVQRSVTETWDGDGRSFRFLKYKDIASVSSVTALGAELASTEYVYDAELGLLRLRSKAFGAGVANSGTVYVAGMASAQDSASIPGDVYGVLLDWTRAAYDEVAANALAASVVSIGPTSMTLKPDLSVRVRALVQQYRDMRA
jgi:hypothetical protein